MRKMILGAVAVFAACAGAGDGRRFAEPFPDGAVQAQGWLRKQLELQRDGLTGHAERLYADIGESDWLTGAKRGGEFAWERGPYYAKGLVALAFALDDDGLKARAKRWVDAILASQRADGDFGPKIRNWWANMIALWLVRDWAAATGDGRVLPFLERYFDFQTAELKKYALGDESKWATSRGGDEVDVALWAYRRTGRGKFLDFAKLVMSQTADWTGFYHRGGDPVKEGCRSHIVNFMQGLKTPALKWEMGGNEEDRTAYRAAFDPSGWLMKAYGRPDRMVNGSETLSNRSASEGTELCAIAERILSNQVSMGVFGDAELGDDLETVAYNTLPSTLSTDGKGMRYYNLLNVPHCANRPLGFVNNGRKEGAICPGPHSGFGCCRSNFHFAWPKFVQSMWMKTSDGGVAAAAYGPSRLEAEIGDRKVRIVQTGSYPFGPDARIAYEGEAAEFPFHLRIPRWCGSAKARLNGEELRAKAEPGKFLRIVRTWKAGDVLTLEFPMKAEVETGWTGNSAVVRRGPLLYSLKLKTTERQRGAYDIPFEKRKADPGSGFPSWEILCEGEWNKALLLDANGGLQCETETAEIAGNPFTSEGTPVRLKVKTFATRFAGWGYMQDQLTARPAEPPPSPMKPEGNFSVSEMIPMGSTQVRITLLPWGRADVGEESRGAR